jgi:hypothetical protein
MYNLYSMTKDQIAIKDTGKIRPIRRYLFFIAQLRYLSTVASMSPCAPSLQVAKMALASVLISSFMLRAL